MQLEIERRRQLGKSYSGKSVLSAKLICEDCGAFYGQKVWHSTDKFRRTIWQCNNKFKNEHRCQTPTLDTETIQAKFIVAYNSLMIDVDTIIADCEQMRRSLADCSELDAAIARQTEEVEIIAGLAKAAVIENAISAQSQKDYAQGYESLNRRYAEAAAELERLKAEHARRLSRDKAMGVFVRSLRRQPRVLDSWDSTIWTVMFEKGIVHRDGSVTFVFNN